MRKLPAKLFKLPIFHSSDIDRCCLTNGRMHHYISIHLPDGDLESAKVLARRTGDQSYEFEVSLPRKVTGERKNVPLLLAARQSKKTLVWRFQCSACRRPVREIHLQHLMARCTSCLLAPCSRVRQCTQDEQPAEITVPPKQRPATENALTSRIAAVMGSSLVTNSRNIDISKLTSRLKEHPSYLAAVELLLKNWISMRSQEGFVPSIHLLGFIRLNKQTIVCTASRDVATSDMTSRNDRDHFDDCFDSVINTIAVARDTAV
jgi:hypothetical protein